MRDIKLTTSNYEIDSEILIKASKKGYKIESIPVKTIYKNEISQINPLIDTFRFMLFISKITKKEK